MGPIIVASTLLLILAVGVCVGLVGFLAAETPALGLAGLHARLSRSVRRSCLMPLGFVAFTVLTTGQIQGQGTSVPSLEVSRDFPKGGGMTEDMVTRIVTQGGAVAVLLVVLWSYRRDFFRKLEEKDQTINALLDVLERSSVAITNSVNASKNQTDATNRLSRTVENIERKMTQRRQGDDHP